MPSCDGPVLEAVDLHRAYGPSPVLRGVALRLGPGEALAVVGPNAAGKTTLLRVLAGLVRPSRGEVRIFGRYPPRAAEARRAIGLLAHQSLLYDDLTVLENLTFAARLYRVPDPQEAAERALVEVGLAERASSRPRELSRGLLQRASFARALVHDPTVLLLDEPFTALDAPAAERLRLVLWGRLARGGAMVLATHHLGEIWDLVTRVAVLAGGRWALEEERRGELAAFLPRYQEVIHA